MHLIISTKNTPLKRCKILCYNLKYPSELGKLQKCRATKKKKKNRAVGSGANPSACFAWGEIS